MVSPAYPNRTLAQVLYEVARRSGLIRGQGTATAGTTTTLTDATRFRVPVAEANSVTGRYLYIYGGTAVGQIREVSSYATIGIMTWNTAGTAPDTTSTWILLDVDPQAIIDAIADVTRDAVQTQAQPYPFDSLVTNNLLHHYGDFEEWENGAAAAPDGFGTLVNATAARLSSASTPTPRHGLYALEVTDDGSAGGYLPFTVHPSRLLALEGQSLQLLGTISQSALSVGRVRVIPTDKDGGTANAKNWDADEDGNRWREFHDIDTAAVTMPSTLNSLEVRLTALTASGVARFDDLVLYGPDIYDYDLPANIIGLEHVITMESGYRTGRFTKKLVYGETWEVIRNDPAVTTNRVIRFKGALPSARHLHVRGYIAPTVQTTHSGNLDINPQFAIPAAAIRLLEGMPATEENDRRLRRFSDELDAMRKDPKRRHIVETTAGVNVKWLEVR